MPPQFNLGSLLQPFSEQSPVNLLSMIAQSGLQNPQALASVLAARGAVPPTGTSAAALPTVGKVLQGATQPSPGGPGGIAPSPQPIAPQPAPGRAPQGGRIEGLLEAVSKLKAPPLPEVAQPPGAIAPRPGGPGPNPALLARLLQLLQAGGGGGGIPSLGQLIAGKGATGPALTL